jgi:hypothetical protein
VADEEESLQCTTVRSSAWVSDEMGQKIVAGVILERLKLTHGM